MNMFELIKLLDEAKVEFVLVGGLAVALQGYQRVTMDVLVRPVVSYAEPKRDASLLAEGSIKIPVASIEHLISMKTGTGRSKDMIDIEELRKFQVQPC
jgi:hypothetical protein